MARYINVFLNHKFLLSMWLILTIVGVVTKYIAYGYNNYLIFKGVFVHYINQLPLYGPSPAEYFDMNHYGIVFAFVIAPFAMMPDWLGLMLWMVVGVVALYFAVKSLPIEPKWQAGIMLLSANELYTAVAYQQFTIWIIAMILFAFVCIEKRKEGWAALLILVGTFVKIYGIVGLAFFFFVKRKWRFVGFFALWTVVLAVLPMVFTSPQYVISQYAAWIADLGVKNSDNIMSGLQNISLLGVVRKISGDTSYSDLWIMGGALVIFMASYLRRSQFSNINFRLMTLASVLLFVVLFSTGSEGCSYIYGTVGAGIWLAVTPLRRTWVVWTLVGLMIFASFAGNILPSEIYLGYFRHYALKAIPFALVWFRICYEMLTCEFYNKIEE